jgi:hypothetical protein
MSRASFALSVIAAALLFVNAASARAARRVAQYPACHVPNVAGMKARSGVDTVTPATSGAGVGASSVPVRLGLSMGTGRVSLLPLRADGLVLGECMSCRAPVRGVALFVGWIGTMSTGIRRTTIRATLSSCAGVAMRKSMVALRPRSVASAQQARRGVTARSRVRTAGGRISRFGSAVARRAGSSSVSMAGKARREISVVAGRRASADRWAVPHWWWVGAMCVHRHESVLWHIVNSPYAGGMQFELGTWHRAGGNGSSLWAVARASPREQLYRAWKIWSQDGGSWREWPTTSRMCGLR